MPIQRPPLPPRPKTSHVEIYWKTVTYRTVAVYLVLILFVVMAILYLIYPEAYSGAITRISQALGAGAPSTAQLTAKQAKFVNLDGRVQIKKVNSVQWVAADYRMALDKGDLIQTSGDGVARITFADGTTYTVQSDTLVTVEENSVGRDSETRVGHAHHIGRRGPGHRHLGFSEIQGRSFVFQRRRFGAAEQPRGGAQRSHHE